MLPSYTIQYKNHTLTPLPLVILALFMATAITFLAISFRFMVFTEALTAAVPLSLIIFGCGFCMGCFVEGSGEAGEGGE